MNPAPRMSVLDPAGAQASEIATLWDVFLGVSVAVWTIVVALAAAATVVSYRRKRAHGENDPLSYQPLQYRRLVQAIVAAGVLTVLTLIALLVGSVVTSARLADLTDEADALHVRITGRQWWWHVDYWPDDPARVATTANELHLPVGTVVQLELTSADVIHSFWVPSLHGKKDLIPGRFNRTWLRIEEPGIFRGQCAEFCGLEHAKMAITIVAQPREEFEVWLAHQRKPAAMKPDPRAMRGLAVFEGGPCGTCHTIAGTRAGGRLGPDLTHVASRMTLGAGTVPNTVGHLAGWIIDPQHIKPGSHMPPTVLPAEDVHALLVFLGSLR